MLAFYAAFLSIRTLKIPLIALLNGHAIGAGLCLACAHSPWMLYISQHYELP